MPEAAPARELDDRHLAQAAEWFAILQSRPDEDQRRAWQTWRDADPGHAAAWQRVEAIHGRFHDLAARVDRGAAASALNALRVERPDRRRGLKLLGVIGLAGSAGYLGWRTEPWQDWTADAHTAVGERGEFRLADGTRLQLNTDTAVRAAAAGLGAELLRGEVLVDVSAGAGRSPWRLTMPEGAVDTRGARFSAWRSGTSCEVAVFEGAVEVRSARSGASGAIAAGQRARFDRDLIGALSAAPATLAAWVRALYVADGTPLGQMSRDLARHRRGLISCDERVAALRVVGTFPLDDDAQLWRALMRALPVRVSNPLPGWTRIEPV